MSPIRLYPVTGRRGLREFFAAGDRIYAGDRRWVPPIRQQVRRWWRDGVRLFVLRDRAGQPVGRTTMHADDRFDAKLGRRHQLFGLTEFANPAAGEVLFEAIATAGRQSGCQALFGPVGLLPNQSGGVITSGFDQRGSIDSGYNPPYYPAAYERSASPAGSRPTPGSARCRRRRCGRATRYRTGYGSTAATPAGWTSNWSCCAGC